MRQTPRTNSEGQCLTQTATKFERAESCEEHLHIRKGHTMNRPIMGSQSMTERVSRIAMSPAERYRALGALRKAEILVDVAFATYSHIGGMIVSIRRTLVAATRRVAPASP
jgi:hypothetical protein